MCSKAMVISGDWDWWEYNESTLQKKKESVTTNEQ